MVRLGRLKENLFLVVVRGLKRGRKGNMKTISKVFHPVLIYPSLGQTSTEVGTMIKIPKFI
jgi:hypothetical protein